MSFADIRRHVHLSPSSVRERIQKLEDTSLIKAYTLYVDHTKFGYGIQVFIMLKIII